MCSCLIIKIFFRLSLVILDKNDMIFGGIFMSDNSRPRQSSDSNKYIGDRTYKKDSSLGHYSSDSQAINRRRSSKNKKNKNFVTNLLDKFMSFSLPIKIAVCTCTAAVITVFVLLILLIVHSPSANKTAEKFIEECRKGDTQAMQEYLPSAYVDLPEDLQELIASVESSDEDSQSDTESQEKTEADESENVEQVSLQTVILTHSDFEKSIILTLDNEDILEVKITGPDMQKIIDEVITKYRSEDGEEITSDSLYDAIVSLINDEKYTYTHSVEIPMYSTNGKWYVDFASTEIWNELTGGLSAAYSNLYQQAFDELMEYYGMTDGKENTDEN